MRRTMMMTTTTVAVLPRRFFCLLWAFLFAILACSGFATAADDAAPPNIVILKTVDDVETIIRPSSNIWMIQILLVEKGQNNEKKMKDFMVLSKLLNGMIQLATVDLSVDDDEQRSEVAQAIMGQKEDFPNEKEGGIWYYTIAPSPFDNRNSAFEKYNMPITVQDMANVLMKMLTNTLSKRAEALNLGTSMPHHSSTSSSNTGSGGSSSKGGGGGGVVVELDDTNFEQYVYKTTAIVAVAFTAPWCGHCSKLRPEWDEAAQKLTKESNDNMIILGWMDATKYTEIANMYNVRGYPTIKIFPGGGVMPKTPDMAKDYPGGRDANSIVQFLLHELDKSGLNVVKEIPQLTNPNIFQEECTGHNHICVLAALPHILDSTADGRNRYLDILKDVAQGFRGIGSFSFLWFEVGTQNDLETKLELTFGAPALVAYSMHRNAYAVLRGSFTEKSVTAFLHGITTGRQRTTPVAASGNEDIVINTVESWDGQDGQPLEEEIPLSEIMGDDEF